jgi:class 3 adenylate cyclase
MSLRAEWSWDLNAPRERLWRYLADTDWVNEHAGLPRIEARYEPQPEGGSRRYASLKQGPFTIEWEERPTIWRVPEYFAVERLYVRGPLKRFFTSTTLAELSPDRTHVVVTVDLEAASLLTEGLLPIVAATGKRGANRAFRLAERLAAAAEIVPNANDLGAFAVLPPAGIAPEVAAAIAGFVDGAEDRDLVRMRPYELADRWHQSRREVLRAFLAATRRGLFNLSWSVICPGCRGPSPGMESLETLEGGYHCPSCNVAFDAVFDRSVEVTFDAKPLGRGADAGLFCIASPQRSPHVFGQFSIAAGEAQDFEVALEPGTYDVHAMGTGVAPFVAARDEAEGDLEVSLHALTGIDSTHAVRSGSVRGRIENDLDGGVIVRIEDGRWPDTIATAAQVTALQEFRDLFSSQVLAPGLQLSVETMAVLFTDLIGSTAMYARTGDAGAFRIVNDHFGVVRDIVARYEGAIVKTIGDAVMAVFVDPAKCFDAALELDESIRTISADGEPLRMRVGFHVGPCIAMRANDRIDYFGTTVNLAARLESLARAGEITLAKEVALRPAIATRLGAAGERVTEETARVKGIADDVTVIRISASASDAA